MKKYVALTLTVGFLAACSQDGPGGNNGQKPLGSDATTQQFQESYQLKLNGCDTSKHSFGSDSSYDDVKKQLCDALQDDKLNGSCAEPLRKEFFDKKCSGIAWNPKFEEPVPPSQSAPSNPADNITYATQEKVRDALQFVLVDKYEVNSTLAPQEKQAATQFAEGLMSCGLSYLGPKCLDYETLADNYAGTLSQVDGKYIFYSELKIKGAGTLVALVFKVDQVQPVVKISTVEISKILKPRTDQSIDQYLKDTSVLGSLVKVSLAADLQATASKRIQSPRDIRELFHVSKMLLETNRNNYLATRNAVASAIAKNKDVITASQDVRYQEEMLSFITSQIELKNDVLVSICSELLGSSISENGRQIAAIIVMDADPSRADLKPDVLKALNNQSWNIKNKAISALSKVQKTSTEENQLVAKIGDDDGDVRKVAITAVSKISVNDNHLAEAKALSTNRNWQVRVEAAKLLSRINSDESIQALIGLMNDDDSDVHTVIMQELSTKQIKDSFVEALTKNYKSRNWNVRRDVSILLAKNSSLAATTALISQMNDDDGDVQAKIYSLLAGRSLTNDSVSNLKKNFSSQNWMVRRDVAKLLGTFKTPASLAALEDQLTKESDGDVKNQIITSIKAVKK